MRLVAVGVGPGDPELLTFRAARLLREADLVLAPVAAAGRESIAGNLAAPHCGRPPVPFIFPMVRDEAERDARIAEQLETLRPCWEGVSTVALPVIGDATLYATAAWLYDVWKGLYPPLDLQLVPGVSAHSLAASRVGEFLALAEERLAIIPCTADADDMAKTLRTVECAALYKPSALGAHLPDVVAASGPWARMVRIERAGLPDERILWGDDAVSPTQVYLSMVLLWRRSTGRGC